MLSREDNAVLTRTGPGTAVVLAPGESWVDGARPRMVVRPGDQLSLA